MPSRNTTIRYWIFYRYYRSCADYLDAAYFVRGKSDMEQYLETFYYERDPQFSTNCDFKVARILANDMLQALPTFRTGRTGQ